VETGQYVFILLEQFAFEMGFLDRIFGKKGEEVTEGPMEIRAEEIDGLLEKRLEDASSGMAGELEEIVDDITRDAGEIIDILHEIEQKDFPEEVEKRIYKPVKTAKPRYVRGIKDAAEGLRAPVGTRDIEGYKTFHKKVVSALRAIEKIQIGSGRYLALVFEEEIMRIGTRLNRIIDYTKELGESIEDYEQRVSLMEETKKAKERLDRLTRDVMETRKRPALLEKALADTEQEISDTKKELDVLKESPEYRSLLKLETKAGEMGEEMEEIRSRVFTALSPLGRLFRKYQKLMEGTGEVEIIAGFIHDPVGQFQKGLGPAPILQGIKKAVDGGHLKVKEKEKNRTWPKLEKALETDFEGLLEDYRRLDGERRKIQAAIGSSPISTKKDGLEGRLEDAKKRLEDLKKEQDGMEDGIKGVEEERLAAIKELESLLGELEGREVRVVPQGNPY
jgi:hypothetical protein